MTLADRGRELTPRDLEKIAEDLYAVREWSEKKMGMKPDEARRQMVKALEALLGRRSFSVDRDPRPWNCRFVLRERGLPHQEKSCAACRRVGSFGERCDREPPIRYAEV